MTSGHGLARRVLPWLVAAGCLAYSFAVVPLDECWATLRRSRLELFVPLAVASVLVWFALESAAYAYAFSRFNDARLSWREARSLRALTYLLTAIHWHLAKAAVVVRLGASHGVPLLASTSTLLLYQMIGVLVLALFAAAAAPFLPSSDAIHAIALASLAVASAVSLALFLIRSDRPRVAWLDELRGLSLLQAHRRLALRDLAILGLSRAAYQLVFVLAYYYGLRAFDLAPSFSHVMVATPLLQAVGSLPIAPAGFGTQQAAMLLLFSDPEARGRDGAAILAFGFSLPIFTMLLRAGLACIYLGELSGPKAGRHAARTGLARDADALESVAASD
jgi:hypothetical protein